MPALPSETKLQIILPNRFTQAHERVLTRYLSDDRGLDTAARQMLYEAIDLLSQAEVRSGTSLSTFRQIYDEYVDHPFADAYFERLLTLADVSTQSPSLNSCQFEKCSFARLETVGFILT